MPENLGDFSRPRRTEIPERPASLKQLFQTERRVPQTEQVAINLNGIGFRFYFQNKALTPQAQHNIQIL